MPDKELIDEESNRRHQLITTTFDSIITCKSNKQLFPNHTMSYKHMSGIEEALEYHNRNMIQQQDAVDPDILITTTLLLDLWGVLHNGIKPYDGVLETIRKLRQLQNVRLVVLSNSSLRQSHTVGMLRKMGFNPEVDFDQVITAGEIAHRMLTFDESLPCEKWNMLGNNIQQKSFFVLGNGVDDEEFIQSCSGWKLSPIDEAELILARGAFTIVVNKETTVRKMDDELLFFQLLDEVLDIAAKRGLPMLVSNPDKTFRTKNKRTNEDYNCPMPGAYADWYQEKLISNNHNSRHYIKRLGKPYREIYEIALNSNSSSSYDYQSAIMVGDALGTDIVGSISYGCSSIWVVNDGIHNDDVIRYGKSDFKKGVDEVLQIFNAASNDDVNMKKNETIEPTFVLPHFRW